MIKHHYHQKISFLPSSSIIALLALYAVLVPPIVQAEHSLTVEDSEVYVLKSCSLKKCYLEDVKVETDNEDFLSLSSHTVLPLAVAGSVVSSQALRYSFQHSLQYGGWLARSPLFKRGALKVLLTLGGVGVLKGYLSQVTSHSQGKWLLSLPHATQEEPLFSEQNLASQRDGMHHGHSSASPDPSPRRSKDIFLPHQDTTKEESVAYENTPTRKYPPLHADDYIALLGSHASNPRDLAEIWSHPEKYFPKDVEIGERLAFYSQDEEKYLKHGMVVIYTDGGVDNNPGHGGWAALLRWLKDGIIYERGIVGTAPKSTNNRMEALAVMEGMRALYPGTQAVVYSDSLYVVEGATKKSHPHKRNQSLWQQLYELKDKHNIHFVHIKRETNLGNIRADRATHIAREHKLNKIPDKGKGHLPKTQLSQEAPKSEIKGSTTIYADGSCLSESNEGGWASLIIFPSETQRSLRGSSPITTNSRMSLLAVIQGLQCLKSPTPAIEIFTDDLNIVTAYKDGWFDKWHSNNWTTAQDKPVKNKELWLSLLRLTKRHEKVVFHWLDGKPNHYRKLVESMSTKARDGQINQTQDLPSLLE